MSGHSTRFARAASFIAIVAGIGFASEANAASFDVKIGTDFPLDPAEYGNCKCVSTAPSKDCTIRAAIQASNMCSQPVDVIKLDDILPAVYRLSISGAGDDTGTIGDWDVFRDTANGGTTGSKTVYLNLNGQIITPDAGVVDRFFDIPATETQLTLNISAGRLQNAQTAWPEKGGCLRARAGKLTLSSMVFQNCRAYHSGGAVEVSDVTLEVTNSNFGGNGFNVPLTYPHNPTGGALAARDSTVTIEGSGFVDNSAQTGGGSSWRPTRLPGRFKEASPWPRAMSRPTS
ncbi:MAG: hypothetical protein R3B72_27650 [Polyangiaceae bacterium]